MTISNCHAVYVICHCHTRLSVYNFLEIVIPENLEWQRLT